MAVALLLGLSLAGRAQAEAGRYLETADFLTAAFAADKPARKVLWLTAGLRQQVDQLLGHPYRGLRIGYWKKDAVTALVLDEIGKDKPITIGVILDQNRIREVQILEFRESRGWEVRYPFFTRQFVGASLNPQGELDRHIDGITGATLSVGAVSRVATLALFLNSHIGSK